MASIETGPPPQATTEAKMGWSSKLMGCVSRSGVVVKNQRKVDVTLRLFLFVFSFIAVIVTVTSKQTMAIHVSPVMTMSLDAKFTYIPSFTYFVAANSVISLYSMITGYSSYSALKKQERNQPLHLVLLDSLVLSISTSAMGAAGGVAYVALRGNTHVRWMKICNIFDRFCHHLASAGAMSLLTSITLLVLIWFSVCAIVNNSGR